MKEMMTRWLTDPAVDDQTRAEVASIAENEEEILSRFGACLSFGTAGLRGIIGAGTNRMNIYVVRQATQGLADLILSMGSHAAERGAIAVFFPASLLWNPAACLLQTALRRISLTSFAPRPRFLLPSVI